MSEFARNGGIPLLDVEGLEVCVGAASLVEAIGFEASSGDLLAIVGESGSGKTTTALAMLGFAKAGGRIVNGTIRVGDHVVTSAGRDELQRIRGGVVGYVPQNPARALNPAMRVGDQVREVLEVHGAVATREKLATLFERVALPSDSAFRRRFPHQLSGGQLQRVVIAMAIACSPDLVVLDEPTTALDVITQARILALIRRLRDEERAAFVYVTHDLAVVRELATAVVVMYAGRIVEAGTRENVFLNPQHPYTRRLLAAIPQIEGTEPLRGIPGISPPPGFRPAGCAFAPRCDLAIDLCRRGDPPDLTQCGTNHAVACIRWRERESIATEEVSAASASPGSEEASRAVLAVDNLTAQYRHRPPALVDVSLSVKGSECVAVVGESGSGKTTLARCIVGLHTPVSGSIALDGRPLRGSARGRTREERRAIQIVFQNPDESLNPCRTVQEALSRPVTKLLDRTLDAGAVVREALDRVRLPSRMLTSYPRELSGGERQRVALARAIIVKPKVLVCDEVTSALDVSIQAVVLELIAELRTELALGLVFISHDMGVVASVADEVVVLRDGRVEERGPKNSVLRSPTAAYTQNLLAARVA